MPQLSSVPSFGPFSPEFRAWLLTLLSFVFQKTELYGSGSSLYGLNGSTQFFHYTSHFNSSLNN